MTSNSNIEKIEVLVSVDKNSVYSFCGKINEQSIIQCAKDVEEILTKHGVDSTKLQDVYELTVEIMQNMLNYSYDTKEIGNNKREATGTYKIFYNSSNKKYILESSNLIEIKDEEIIKEKLADLKGLDDRALRKLARVKMREHKDKHKKGAGLGFIVMARKSTKEIEIAFENIDNQIKRFNLKLVV